MGRRLVLLAVMCLLAAGCVSKKTFVAKSQEVDLAAAALAAERQKSGELALRTAQLEGQLAEVQKALAAAAAERERLGAALVTARGDVARLEGQLAEASDQRDTLAKQLAIAEQTTSQKDVNIQELTYRYDGLVKGLEQQKVEIGRRATELSGRLAEAESRLSALTEELASTRQALGETKEALAERERKLKEATATYDRLVADLKGEIAEGQVKITRLRDKLTVNLVDKILFDSGSTAIRPRGQEVLRKVARVLKTVTGKRIQIEGHTDNVPVGGGLQARFPTNWELSVARATVVARFLEEQGALSPALLAATGYGEHHPVASNETLEGRAQNRRIEIVLLPLLDAVVQ